jgi:hypothetical protein
MADMSICHIEMFSQLREIIYIKPCQFNQTLTTRWRLSKAQILKILSKKVKKFKFIMDKTTPNDQDVPPRLAWLHSDT